MMIKAKYVAALALFVFSMTALAGRAPTADGGAGLDSGDLNGGGRPIGQGNQDVYEPVGGADPNDLIRPNTPVNRPQAATPARVNQGIDIDRIFDVVKDGLPRVTNPIEHNVQKSHVSEQYLDQAALEAIRANTFAHAGLGHVVGPNMADNGLMQAKIMKIGDFTAVDFYGDSMINYEARELNGHLNGAESSTVYLTAAAVDSILEDAISAEGFAEVNTAKVTGNKVNLLIDSH